MTTEYLAPPFPIWSGWLGIVWKLGKDFNLVGKNIPSRIKQYRPAGRIVCRAVKEGENG